MQSIKIRQRVGQDGVLHLDIPTNMKDDEVEVVVVYQLVQKAEKRHWSPEFLRTFGAWQGELVRAPQEEQAEREPLE